MGASHLTANLVRGASPSGSRASGGHDAIHVLHVIDSLGVGGAERQLVNLLAAHDRSVVRSSVVTLYDSLELAEPLRAIGVPVHSLALRSRWQWPSATWRLANYVRSEKPDIVHTRLVDAALVGRIAALVAGRYPVVSSVETPLYSQEIHRDNRRWKVEGMRLADLVTGRLSGATYVGCSRTVAHSISHALRLPPDRLQVIHNSTDVVEGERHPLADVVLTREDEVRLLTVGRLTAEKGHIHLLRALPSLVHRFPHLILQVAGDGPLRNALIQECRAIGIGAHVTFLGRRDDVPSLLRQAHVAVFSSLWEGFGLAVLEAMAAGVPVVATDIAATREIIDDGTHGVLVKAENAEVLAEAILALLSSAENRASISEAARRRAGEEFDVQVAVGRYERLYAELLASRVDMRSVARASLEGRRPPRQCPKGGGDDVGD